MSVEARHAAVLGAGLAALALALVAMSVFDLPWLGYVVVTLLFAIGAYRTAWLWRGHAKLLLGAVALAVLAGFAAESIFG